MMSDDQIIQSIRLGKRSEALANVYRHYPKIRQMVVTANGSEDDAKDIFQESVIIFYQKAEKPDFQLTASISTFLYSVCRNLWLKQYRNKANLREQGWDQQPEPGHHEADQWLDESPDAAAVADQMLTVLGDPCLSILKAYYYQRLSMRAIAEKLGLGSEGNAKTRKFKCLERAKKMLRDRFPFLSLISILNYEN
jgi:RNA polymerase sigma factor (sigma-70 family)